MASEYFPIICWQLSDDTVVGQVLGTGLTVVDTSARRLTKTASEQIAKAIREGAYLAPPDIDNPALHYYNIDVQLSYREEEGVYPLSETTPFRVAAVHGDSDEAGFGQCFLPYLDEDFYYYNIEQRRTLIEHFTREFLQNQVPEQAYHYIMPSEPWLDMARVQVSARRKKSTDDYAVPEILLAVADPMPIPKKLRRQVTRLPDVAWERAAEVSRVGEYLLDGRSNILLVGAQGVGKSTLWNEVVRSAVREQGDVDGEPALTVWRTTCQRLVAKARYLGEWQAICDEVVAALAQVNGVLWFTDFVSLLNTGGDAQEDSVAAYLQSYMRRGQLRVIAEARPQELELARGMLPSFVHLFETLKIAEMDDAATKRVLRQYAGYAAANFTVDIRQDALDLGSQLVNRYIKYEKNPGRLLRFFGECLKNCIQAEIKTITREIVIEQFIKYTGLPEILLRDDRALPEADIRTFFQRRIKGQDALIGQLCAVIQMFKAGLNDPDKPIATLLFAGPTGVGKTAATKALGEFFFSAGQARNPLFAIDMSEFQHPAQVSRLIGERNKAGKLVEHVRSQPFSVILLDEIEKAHPSVFDMLLTVLDEGVLTDRFGRVTDFRSSIIVMTTNLGVEAGRGPGFLAGEEGQVSVAAIRKHFRPEFYNRIDAVLLFQSLDHGAVLAITRRELALLQQRDRIRQQNIELSFSAPVVEFLASVGFSKTYGARPIQRAIEKHVVGAIADLLLQGKNVKAINMELEGRKVIAVGR